MRKLRTHFNLVLSTALLVATLLPVLILYLLSVSGLVEATYITDTHDLRPTGRLLSDLVQDTPPVSPDLAQPPVRNDSQEERRPLQLTLQDPGTGQPRVDLLLDPVTGLWTRLSTNQIKRIIVTSQVFNFRADLPAWIVIGSLPIFGLLMGFFLSMVMSRGVTQPISQLVEAAKAVSRRDLDYRVETQGSQELQELAHSFNRMAEELEQAEITRRNLMADVAHELRTPLAVLNGNLRAMLDGVHALSEEEIALLYEQTQHLNRLVEDLRELSLAEADQLFLNRQEVDLAQLVKETVAHFEFIAEEQGINISEEIDNPLIQPGFDENRIRQVMHNLLSNAFRHTPREGSIVVFAKKISNENVVEIAVKDTGEGISPEDLPHIFNRFYRMEKSVSRDRGGTGLGLAIVKAIVEALGGTVSVQSAGRDQGSTFTIRFSGDSGDPESYSR
jgi:signal transduction histidine kinase